MILMLFGAIAVAGALGTGYMATMKGPGKSLTQASRANSIENQMMAATKLVLTGDAAQQDCDADGTIEPMPFATGPGPSGGGIIPMTSGAVKNDPWGKQLGYCVWDHGKQTVSDNITACGGGSANRLQGGEVASETVLAVISAGKDGVFQTTCNGWLDVNDDKIADTPLIVTPPGSDDIVRRDTIETLLASGFLSQLPSLPDSACVPGQEGILRYQNGVPQVCTSTGWKEIGGDTGSMDSFTPVSGVNPSTTQTSNAITMTGFFGSRTATVDNGAILVVNGTPRGSSYDVVPNDTVALRATSSASYSTATNYTLEVGAMNKPWSITTVAPDFTPNNFTFTNQTDLTPSTMIESNIVQVNSIAGLPTTSIIGTNSPSYRICADAACSSVITNWTSGSATIQNNQYLQLRQTTSSAGNTTYNAAMTVGTYTAPNWTITTWDATPNAFDFTDQIDVMISTLISSNILQISGITGNIPTSVTGGNYRICSDAACASVITAWTSGAATIQNNQYLQLQVTSSASNSTAVNVSMTVGTVTSTSDWSVTTVPPCTGYTYQGYCWFRSSKGGSCTSRCSSRGGNTPGTINVSGNAGTMAHCSHLLTYFGLMGDGTTRNGGGGNLGCVYYDGFIFGNNERRWWETGATSYGSSSSDRYRICSCGY